MTLDEMRAAGKVALCQLPGGTYLRYEPSDGSVRSLPYPDTPTLWREASAYVQTLPADGWTHYPGCECSFCKHEREELEEPVSA